MVNPLVYVKKYKCIFLWQCMVNGSIFYWYSYVYFQVTSMKTVNLFVFPVLYVQISRDITSIDNDMLIYHNTRKIFEKMCVDQHFTCYYYI